MLHSCDEQGGDEMPVAGLRRPGVPVKAPGPLEDEIDRGQVGHHYVEVEVKTLFYHLRCDEDRSVGTGSGSFAEHLGYFYLQTVPNLRRKPSVKDAGGKV